MVIFSIASFIINNVPANDTKSCAVSGFTSLLKCSSCSELKKFKLEKIETSCFQCCEDENKYAFAELVTLLAFIDSKDRKSMTNLKVVYERGHRPTIRMLNEKRQVQEEIPIDTWDSDTIIEFVNERITNQ
ncbi:unnamed protein product [Schistosoma mattheei]|uniref:Selenoprotein F n=1 Tax=Schistosoma mattheei TaxID=31246 RepID=A0A3P7Z9X2_9TREM|nr:unnamed protein product [Schistosoma mattheei]